MANLDNVRILVGLATYNEKGNLKDLLQATLDTLPNLEVLVIDDNSPDGTGELADQMASQNSRIHVLHRKGKLGLGTAIIAGMYYAIENNFDFYTSMDADFSHNPKYLPAMVAGMAENDIMIGSRYVPGGGTENWPFSRKFISKSVNALVRFLFWISVKDASGGFRCYRVAKLGQIDFSKMRSKGYSFQQEMLYRCILKGAKVGETPIIFENRRDGVSKVNWWEALRSISLLVYLGLYSRISRDP
ncbi:MAG: polyprenol monophosphomannose synthase [Gemmataceae bacterium]